MLKKLFILAGLTSVISFAQANTLNIAQCKAMESISMEILWNPNKQTGQILAKNSGCSQNCETKTYLLSPETLLLHLNPVQKLGSESLPNFAKGMICTTENQILQLAIILKD